MIGGHESPPKRCPPKGPVLKFIARWRVSGSMGDLSPLNLHPMPLKSAARPDAGEQAGVWAGQGFGQDWKAERPCLLLFLLVCVCCVVFAYELDCLFMFACLCCCVRLVCTRQHPSFRHLVPCLSSSVMFCQNDPSKGGGFFMKH